MEKFLKILKNTSIIVGGAVLFYVASAVYVAAVHTAYYMIAG